MQKLSNTNIFTLQNQGLGIITDGYFFHDCQCTH